MDERGESRDRAAGGIPWQLYKEVVPTRTTKLHDTNSSKSSVLDQGGGGPASSQLESGCEAHSSTITLPLSCKTAEPAGYEVTFFIAYPIFAVVRNTGMTVEVQGKLYVDDGL